MDNVACYGFESQLLDCNYHADTSEDEHSEDIWVNCGAKDSSDDSTLQGDVKQSRASSTAALIVALAVFLLVIIAGAVYILVRYLKKKKNSPVDER